MAAAIAGLTPLVGTSLAERITTAFWPPLLFAVYALVLVRGVRGLVNGRAAILALFAATQTIVLMMQFAPGGSITTTCRSSSCSAPASA